MTTTTTNRTKKNDFTYADDVPTLNKKMSRQISFKTRMLEVNKALLAGKPLDELELNQFELEALNQEGNFKTLTLKGTQTEVKLFNYDLINKVQRKINRIKARRNELAKQPTKA